ncbi:MAG TPA: replication-associated recombination protein A [Candidatus Limnocylindrales bacterium]|nr:replication-associated recombination protein A [Candidatus Limnocylindrales bacterium]
MSKRRQTSLFEEPDDSEEREEPATAGRRARRKADDLSEAVSHDARPERERVPLAERMRPMTVDELAGQAKIVGPGTFLGGMLRGTTPPRSLLLWGPPGSGKTTIARLLAGRTGYELATLSAVLGGIKDLRELLAEARERRRAQGKGTILFVDEIHRFNKAQQDAFLPHVESGDIVLVGATTENPSFEVNAPLLSRCRLVVLEPLSHDDIASVIDRALTDRERGLGELELAIDDDAKAFLAGMAQGDARGALGALEVAADIAVATGMRRIDRALAEEALQRKAIRYDSSGEEHYNVISAFIKSMRASNVDASIYWLARLIEAGEDPLFIARRMVIFASEDIGLADPHALPLAIAARDALHFVGMPEGRIPLAHAVAYLAGAPKSNHAYMAIGEALAEVRESGALPVPLHLRNAPTGMMKKLGYGRDYAYPHPDAEKAAGQQYLPDALKGRKFFRPKDK